MKIVVGINGASGAIYGIRLLQVLADIQDMEVHLVVTDAGEQTIEIETEYKAGEVKALASCCYLGNRLRQSKVGMSTVTSK